MVFVDTIFFFNPQLMIKSLIFLKLKWTPDKQALFFDIFSQYLLLFGDHLCQKFFSDITFKKLYKAILHRFELPRFFLSAGSICNDDETFIRPPTFT